VAGRRQGSLDRSPWLGSFVRCRATGRWDLLLPRTVFFLVQLPLSPRARIVASKKDLTSCCRLHMNTRMHFVTADELLFVRWRMNSSIGALLRRSRSYQTERNSGVSSPRLTLPRLYERRRVHQQFMHPGRTCARILILRCGTLSW
jgi:hypothetical protein